jgi:hypothetical protein
MQNFVIVAVFNLPSDIPVIKSILEHEGIPYFFENETIVSIDPLASIAYGGIKLKVHAEDAAFVKEIIDNLDSKLRVVE